MNLFFKSTTNRLKTSVFNTSISKLTKFHNFEMKNFLTVNKFNTKFRYKDRISECFNYMVYMNSPIRLALFNTLQKYSMSIVKKRRLKTPDPKYKMKTKSAARKRFKIVI